ncbi:MAG: oxidoreductase [Chloroflexi bacterium]|nr:oxidoreductase [Chloroflexota bacterium]MCL5075191.1 oxidoreductase [Chloroflexota bacterium]
MSKLKLAFYWAASCGGCDVAVLDLNEKILDVAAVADILLWPIAMDFKYTDVEAIEDKGIDICFYNGAIRFSEHEHLAALLRAKSKVMVAFGSCAWLGGIPGLANVAGRQSIFQLVYKDTPSTDNKEGVFPQVRWPIPAGELTLPQFYDTVKTLPQIIPVEYYLPGCPPAVHQIEAVIAAIVEGRLPPPPAVIGASDKTVCDECKRLKEEKKVRSFVRPHLVVPDPERCLLEQGIVCCGPATRGGCGTRCLNANLPCRGCYGPPPGAVDQGSKLLSAVASIIDSNDPEEIAKIVDQIEDPLGTFYRFGLPSSTLRRARV